MSQFETTYTVQARGYHKSGAPRRWADTMTELDSPEYAHEMLAIEARAVPAGTKMDFRVIRVVTEVVEKLSVGEAGEGFGRA